MTASNTESLRYDDRVVVVTGAGGAIGAAYALEFARRGAKVVVNDFGVSTLGEQEEQRSNVADQVVSRITELGGEAIANYSSVEAGDEIIEQALDSYGRIDVLLNNAGISFPVPFSQMTLDHWRKMMGVHLEGSFICTRAAWPHMQKNKYGRIIMTASPAIYGSEQMVHYCAAKSAIPGFASALALEGAAFNIYCNAIAPTALSRMITEAMPPEIVEQLALDPGDIAQLAVWLCHESTAENGSMFEVGDRFVARMKYAHSRGVKFEQGKYSAEKIREKLDEITDFSQPFMPGSPYEMTKRTGLDMSGLIAPET